MFWFVYCRVLDVYIFKYVYVDCMFVDKKDFFKVIVSWLRKGISFLLGYNVVLEVNKCFLLCLFMYT